jgi:hypothetical protein
MNPKGGLMIYRFEKEPQFASLDELVKHLLAHYRRAHRGETEGLHFEFRVTRGPDGRSGLVTVDRLEPLTNGSNPETESVLIEGNRVVGISRGDLSSVSWLSHE